MSIAKNILIASTAAGLALAFPAHASEHETAQVAEREIINKLNDPKFQAKMADMMSGFSEAMLEIPIGGFLEAVQKIDPKARPDKHINRNTTIGELAGRDNPNLKSDIRRGAGQAISMLGILAEGFGELLPQLRAMGEKMKEKADQSRYQ